LAGHWGVDSHLAFAFRFHSTIQDNSFLFPLHSGSGVIPYHRIRVSLVDCLLFDHRRFPFLGDSLRVLVVESGLVHVIVVARSFLVDLSIRFCA
jgi:hypothetical protein